MLTVYTKENCQPCKAVIRWLDANGLAYELKNAPDHVDYLSELGYRSAPVVVTSGGESFHGFDIGKLQQVIAGS